MVGRGRTHVRRVAGLVTVIGVVAVGLVAATPVSADPTSVSVADVAVTEGDSGSSTAQFTIVLDAPAPVGGFEVEIDTTNGSAAAPGDFEAISDQVLTIPEGETIQTVDVAVAGDLVDEGSSETFGLQVTTSINDPSATGTIIDDDDPPTITIDDLAIGEGAATGSSSGSFSVALSNPSKFPISVFWSPTAGVVNPATEGVDYTIGTGGTLTFSPGATARLIGFQVVGDAADEPNETFRALLTSATGPAGDITKTIGTATILDNDDPAPLPKLALADATVDETVGQARLTVTLDAPPAPGHLVNVSLRTDAGTAGLQNDYSQIAPTGVSFSPGETSKEVFVPIVDDALDEEPEAFTVTMFNVNANEAQNPDPSATVTIADDDALPQLSVAGPVTVSEPAAAGSTTLTYTVWLTPQSGRPVTVDYSTANGTATSGNDYQTAAGTITFDPGQTSKTVSVTVLGDAVNEANEGFSLELSDPVRAELPLGQGAVQTTIVDPSAPPTLGISDAVVGEGGGTVSLQVTLAGSTQQTVTVQFAGESGIANPAATQNSDFALAGGTLTFAPGETAKTIVVTITDDAAAESDETFRVVLTGQTPAGVTISKGTALVKIVDNDQGAPVVPFLPTLPFRLPTPATVLPTPTNVTPTSTTTTVRALKARVLWTRLDGRLNGQRRAAIRVNLNQKVAGQLVFSQGKRLIRSGSFTLKAGNRTVYVLLPANVKPGRIDFQLLLTGASSVQRVLKTKLVLKNTTRTTTTTAASGRTTAPSDRGF